MHRLWEQSGKTFGKGEESQRRGLGKCQGNVGGGGGRGFKGIRSLRQRQGCTKA